VRFLEVTKTSLHENSVASALRQGVVDMPHHGTGFTKTECHSGAAQGDTDLNCETALNYETALLECASGSSPPSARSTPGKLLVLGTASTTEISRWRIGS
jgi:hypothetical protein